MTSPNTHPFIGVLIFLIGVSQGLSASLEPIHRSTVDSKALTFADGPAARFSPIVNGRTHQQTPITSYRGYQYVTYFDSNRQVCVGRRKLPKGPWEIIRFKDHRFASNDSHNAAVIGICDTDGTIHMAFDHHASPLNYRISQLGAAHNPESTPWKAGLFGKVTHSFGEAGTPKKLTYPRFFNAPNGNLMLYYREITSANGDGMLQEYNGDKHVWTPGLGRFIARDMGTYAEGGERSQFRCPYLNSISYTGNRLHVSWIWRDRFEKTDAHNNHDLCYAYSDDHGRTWHNSKGLKVAETGTSFIHLKTPGIVVAPIPRGSNLSNQNTHYAYPDGSLHIVMIHSLKGKGPRRYHHHWRSREGIWHSEPLPFSGDRPKLVGTDERSLFLIHTQGNRLRISKGVPNASQSKWKWSGLRIDSPPSAAGDAVIDLSRWQNEQILSFYGQEEPTKTIRTKQTKAIDGWPSPLNVIDFRLPAGTVPQKDPQ